MKKGVCMLLLQFIVIDEELSKRFCYCLQRILSKLRLYSKFNLHFVAFVENFLLLCSAHPRRCFR